MRFVQAGVMLLGAVLYVLMIGLFAQLITAGILWVIPVALVGWNILLVVATTLAVIDSVRKVRAGKTRDLATDTFVVKLAAIPFFLINFALLALIPLVGFVVLRGGGALLLAFVPLEITLTYLAMIATSVYGWASVVQLRRERVIGTGLTVLYSILLLVFVTDIVAGILLFGHSRRRPGLALAIVFVVFGAALAVIPGSLVEGSEWFVVAGVAVILATIVVALIRMSRLRRRVASAPSEDALALDAVEAAATDKP